MNPRPGSLAGRLSALVRDLDTADPATLAELVKIAAANGRDLSLRGTERVAWRHVARFLRSVSA